jgi:hypothetical protein
VTGADAVGTGHTGATNGAIGSGVIAFRMKVVLTVAGVLDGTIPIQIGASHGLGGVGVINRSDKRALPPLDDPESRLTLRQAGQATATGPPAASSFPVNARWLRRSARPWTDKRELDATSR